MAETKVVVTRRYVNEHLDEYQKLYPKWDVPYEWVNCQLYCDEHGGTKDFRLRFHRWMRTPFPKKTRSSLPKEVEDLLAR